MGGFNESKNSFLQIKRDKNHTFININVVRMFYQYKHIIIEAKLTRKMKNGRLNFSKGGFFNESSFATLFPKYREQYIRWAWPIVSKLLQSYGIACELNIMEGSMTVRTTTKTEDPYIIIKSRDLIKLLSRSVPLQQAAKILHDSISCDIIKIRRLSREREKFLKRRQRLLGPAGSTLKAIGLLTSSYIIIQGNTVSVMGNHGGLKAVRRTVEDCFKNIHPIYHIKTLLIMKELSNDASLQNEEWLNFLPRLEKKTRRRS